MRRDAAALACVCRAAAAAPVPARWRSAVRVGRSGAVLEPANGAFDVTVAPGEDVQAAADRCPPGGCVLLLPGTHAGPLVLAAVKVVHVFGRGRATLRTVSGGEAVVTSESKKATLDGLIIRSETKSGLGRGVWITGGQLTLQGCDITTASFVCVWIQGGANPQLTSCKIYGGHYFGVHITGAGTKGRLDGCHIAGNGQAGVHICGRAHPRLTACK